MAQLAVAAVSLVCVANTSAAVHHRAPTRYWLHHTLQPVLLKVLSFLFIPELPLLLFCKTLNGSLYIFIKNKLPCIQRPNLEMLSWQAPRLAVLLKSFRNLFFPTHLVSEEQVMDHLQPPRPASIIFLLSSFQSSSPWQVLRHRLVAQMSLCPPCLSSVSWLFRWKFLDTESNVSVTQFLAQSVPEKHC